MHNNEPITDTAPVVYTERKDGVLPEYDIRTDRFDVALEMTELMAKDNLAKREERIKAGEKKEDASPSGRCDQPRPPRLRRLLPCFRELC